MSDSNKGLCWVQHNKTAVSQQGLPPAPILPKTIIFQPKLLLDSIRFKKKQEGISSENNRQEFL
jgi:hypothetical protein